MPPKLGPRKLLVASIGVATINYVASACGGVTDVPTSANLPAPVTDGGMDALVPPPTSANLPAPPTSANLPAPPPIDAGDDAADAADAGDAG